MIDIACNDGFTAAAGAAFRRARGEWIVLLNDDVTVEPDALAVRSGLFARRRRLVPADAIDQIDGQTRVIGLRVERDGLRRFL